MTDAHLLPHDEIKISLSKFSDINEQIRNLRSFLMLKEEDVKLREKVCITIKNLIKELNFDFKVYLFGSSVNGLGFRWSDIDISVQTTVCNQQNPQEMLKMIMAKLKENQNQFGGFKDAFNARIPIIKFVDIKSGLKCDLSISNRMALANSKFIKKCLEVDYRYVLYRYLFTRNTPFYCLFHLKLK